MLSNEKPHKVFLDKNVSTYNSTDFSKDEELPFLRASIIDISERLLAISKKRFIVMTSQK